MAVRVALIGAGVMGAGHARIIASQIPGAVLQVVCDADEARARSIADETGAIHAASDPMAAIADASVDAVLIASRMRPMGRSPSQPLRPESQCCARSRWRRRRMNAWR